ncbi:MAG: hypothetical protein M3296_07295 [Actinomycetota bacterium]|nr:hypothetical protein [Actinomycetota bacterium]
MIVSLHDIEPAARPCDPRLDWRAVRDRLDIRAFGMNAFVGAAPGDLVVEPHHEAAADGESGHEEVYVVIAGAARFVLDGVAHEVAAPAFVKPDRPEVHREAYATRAGTIVLAVGGPVGAAFAVSAWERRQLDLTRDG